MVLGLQAHQVAIAVFVHPLEEAGHVATPQTFKFGTNHGVSVSIESTKVYRSLLEFLAKLLRTFSSVYKFAISALCRAHAKIDPVNVEIDTGKPHCREHPKALKLRLCDSDLFRTERIERNLKKLI